MIHARVVVGKSLRTVMVGILKMEILSGSRLIEAQKWVSGAKKVAEKALCHRAQCGTVIVKDDEIIGQGYNAPPLDAEENRMCENKYDLPQRFKYDRTCCVHSEWRAIVDALKNNPTKLSGSRLYFTRVNEDVTKWGKPICTVCSRLTLDVGISEVVLPQVEGLCLYSAKEYNNASYQYTEA
jgi:deoxycytidylate deaminase